MTTSGRAMNDRSPRPNRGEVLPSPIALECASALATRVHGRAAPVRRLFLENDSGVEPPLAQIIRGGRGGSTRLKLLLSLLWVAAAPPHQTTYPARAWAELLDIDDDGASGARRVADALRWLEAHRLVALEHRPGLPPTVMLLREDGTGRPYRIPGGAMKELDSRDEESGSGRSRSEHSYIQLPATFWTSGWAAVLTAPAIAMLLVLLSELGKRTVLLRKGVEASSQPIWLSPAWADARFQLSEDTRSTGFKELRVHGLIAMKRRSVARTFFDMRRMRNVYFLDPSRLDAGPGLVAQ